MRIYIDVIDNNLIKKLVCKSNIYQNHKYKLKIIDITLNIISYKYKLQKSGV